MEFFDIDAVIKTERLILRRLREEDALAIYHNINHDREVLKYYLDRYIEKEEDASVSGTIRFCDETKRYVFAIVLKETDVVIGMINQCSGMNKFFHSIEIGYAIGQKYWHNGYVTEAAKAFIDFLFKRGVHKVFCGVIPENTRSIQVMKNCGMIYEGRKIDEVYYRDRYWDIDQYYLLNPYVSRETSSESAD